jgi:ankyrin repeat protein
MDYFSPPKQLLTDIDTLLLDAVQYSNSVLVLEGIIYGDNYVNINTKNINKETPLMIAVKRNNIEFLEILLKNKNTQPNLQDINGDTALHIAIRNYYYDIAKLLLLDWRTDVNICNKNLETVVHLVCSKGDLELYKLLECYRDLDLTKRDILGYTPFMYCMLKPHRYIINSLLYRNAVVEVPNILDDIGNCWRWFIKHPNFNINSNIKKDTTLFGYSCYRKDVELLEEIFNIPNFIIDTTKCQQTVGAEKPELAAGPKGLALHGNLYNNIELALKGDNVQFIIELLKRIHSFIDSTVINLLFIHIYDDCSLIVILDYLLSVHVIDITYIVFQSITNSRLDVIEQYLLCSTKNVNDNYGNTILNLAVQKDIPINIVRKCLKIGTDPNIENNLDKKPLYYAIEKKNKEYIELLIPVTKLTPEERVYLLEIHEYIRPDILVNIVPIDSLELFEVKHYSILIGLLDKIDKTTRKQLLDRLIETPERCINLLVKLANISLKDSHNTDDIFTLEEFNIGNRSSIIQYGNPIGGRYRTITLESLLKLLEVLDEEYMIHVKDPFDRSFLFNKIVYTTGLPIFIDCIVRKLLVVN